MAKIFFSWLVVSTDNVLVVARELDNLLAEVYRSPVYNPPHTQRNETITNLNPVMHRVQIWGTSDGTTLSSLKGSCDIDASQTESTGFQLLQFIVDGGMGAPRFDPASNQDTYVNTNLTGKTYTVFKSGYGPLIWDLHIQSIPGGGFKFIDGQLFSPGDEYTILIADLVTTTAPAAGKSFPLDIVTMTASGVYTSAMANKMIEVIAASNVTLTVNTFAAIPDFVQFGINTHNFTGNNVTLKLPSGAYCLINGVQENSIYLGRSEEATFIKKGGYLRIVNWDGDYRRVGDRVTKDGIAPWNAIPETGGWKLKTDYPRFWFWYINRLPGGNYFTATDDSAVPDVDKARFGVGSLKFWMPNTQDRFFQTSDGTRAPGLFRDQDVQAHSHPSGVQTNDGGPTDPTPAANFNRAPAHTVISWKIATNPPEINQFASTDLNTGTETRPKSIVTLSYRII